jgi:hypothetical protein
MTSKGNRKNDDYIARLERELSELRNENVTLKAKRGRKSRAQMRKDGDMSREYVNISDHILLLVPQYLFPRIKFLPKNWEVYDPGNKNGFAALVKNKVRGKLGDKSFAEAWTGVITDEIIRKYSELRCKVNNDIRKEFLCKLRFLWTVSWKYYACLQYLQYCCPLLLQGDPKISSLDPDNFAKGVMYWEEADRMEELVDFLVRYVRLVHCNSYFKSKLAINEGKSYIDMLTANDIAYAICLLANGLKSWRSKKANDGVADKDAKMRFSAGEHMKRERGTSTWNKEGREYFKSAETAWKRAFKPGTDDYKVLRQYWNKWIESEGKTFKLGGSKEGVKKKSAHQVLRTIPVGHAKRMAMEKKKAVVVDDDEEEFVYESEDEDDNGILMSVIGEREGDV